MKIFATFASRTYDHDVVELIDAWDEFSVDENPAGFNESRARAIASWGDDLFRWVTVEIDVETAEIYDALAATSIQTHGHVAHIGEPSA